MGCDGSGGVPVECAIHDSSPVRKIRWLAEESLAWIDVREAPAARYNEDVQAAIGRVAAWQADCHGYYRSLSGRIVTQWPYSMSEFRERTSKPDADAYEAAKRDHGGPS